MVQVQKMTSAPPECASYSHVAVWLFLERCLMKLWQCNLLMFTEMLAVWILQPHARKGSGPHTPMTSLDVISESDVWHVKSVPGYCHAGTIRATKLCQGLSLLTRFMDFFRAGSTKPCRLPRLVTVRSGKQSTSAGFILVFRVFL